MFQAVRSKCPAVARGAPGGEEVVVGVRAAESCLHLSITDYYYAAQRNQELCGPFPFLNYRFQVNRYEPCAQRIERGGPYDGPSLSASSSRLRLDWPLEEAARQTPGPGHS